MMAWTIGGVRAIVRKTYPPPQRVSHPRPQGAILITASSRAAALLAFAVASCACHEGVAAASAGAPCDLSGFLAVQHAHVNHAEVTFCGTVVRLRPARHTRSGWHRSIYVDVGHGDRIEIDANLDVMGDFPLRVGEYAVVRGEYYYDPDGREGVHWTHRTDYGPHPPGYLILDGTTYR
jgi:hypothetical protein